MSDIPHPRHPGYETGISDEAAIEERDLIAQAEDEERRVRCAEPPLGLGFTAQRRF